MELIRKFLPAAGLILVFLVFNVLTGGQMLWNMKLVLEQAYTLLIASMGVFFVMTMGCLDLSQGSILGMSSIVICALSRVNVVLAVICGILTGAAMGCINGFFHVKMKIRSFIVTICTMFLFRGLIRFLTSNAPVDGSLLSATDTPAFKITITAVVLALGLVAFHFTKLGTELKAIGSEELAAKYAGVRTDRTKFLIFVLAGAITGLAAFVNVVKVGSAPSNSGSMLEAQILIALVLGGMPISGGTKARFLNVIIGVFFYVILKNGLTMMGVGAQAMQLVLGVLFLLFVALFADRREKKFL